MAKFKTVITTVGAAKIAAVLAGTGSIVLDSNARMAVGDGNGTLPTPVPSQTALVHEVHRAALNSASIDARDPKNIIAELVIPPETGGFWMREMALYDAAGTLLAVGNMAETYKPSLSEGAGRKQVIRMVIAVSDVSAVTISIDSSTVMATKEYVDESIDKHEKSRKHPDATLTEKGFTQLNSATDSASETQAATPKAVKTVMDATNLKAPLASPALSGVPTAPTAPPGTNTQQLANTAFVRAAITALINASPGLLDTLGELAAALGNDANFATTMTNELAGKQPKDTTLTNLSGKDVAGLLQYLGIGPIATDADIQNRVARKLVDAVALMNAIATRNEIDRGEVRKLVSAAGLIGSIATDADIQNRVARKLVDAVALMNAIATRNEIDSGEVRKLVSAAGLIGSIATDADIQSKVSRKLVDARGLIDTIATPEELDSGALRKLVNAEGLINSIATATDIQSKVPRKLIDAAGLAPFMAAKAPLDSPALTGKPTAPTAPQSVSDTQIATTAFVKSAVAALVASSPEALDTLNELALALGNDPNFATTMTNALAGKQSKDATLTSLSGKDIAGLLSYLGIGPIATDADIQSRVERKLVDAVGLINAIATRDEIDSGAARKLVSGAGLINSIATDADIQNKVPRKFVDARGLIESISTVQDVQDGALRKFVNALTLKNYLPVKPLSGNGFIRIPDVPGGTIIQYGQVSKSIGEGVQNVTLPTPFPNSCRFATAIPLNTSSNIGVDIFAQLQSLSSTGINFFFSWATSSTPADGFQWFAIGY